MYGKRVFSSQVITQESQFCLREFRTVPISDINQSFNTFVSIRVREFQTVTDILS